MTLLLLVSYLIIVDVAVGQISTIVSPEAREKALLQASASNNIVDVQRLLKQGVSPSVTAQDKNRRSALILAAAGGHIKIVKMLLSSGADLNYKDSAGLTALNWSAMRRKNAVASQLLKWHVDVNIHDNNGVTPVMYAAGTDNIELLRLLAANGADLNAISQSTKMTPILVAVEQGNTQCLLALLDLGANVNSPNHEGYTALMAAAQSGQNAILKTLITRGAKSDTRDAKGMTALDYAQQHRHIPIVQFLKALKNNQELPSYSS
jgi:ankyrin repeat protein